MVDERGTMRLVDFDCSWLARFAGWPPPSETGHRNYQPELRPWGRWMDTFSGLLIYTSLRALAKNPTPWTTLNTGENMLFRREDFRSPYDTATWTELAGIGDRQVDDLARRLIACCEPGWSATSGLDELIEDARPSGTRGTHVFAPRTKQWWELATAGTPVASVPATPAPVQQPTPAQAPPQQHTPRPYGPAGQAHTRGPWPTPGGGPGERPPTAPRGPRPPGAQWWQGQPGQTPSRSGDRGSMVGVTVIAVFLGIVVAALVISAHDDLGVAGTLLGIATAAVTVLFGRLVVRQRR
jgi:hypothetical protein